MAIPTIPKVVLDNLLASMGSPATPGPLIKQNNGFRQLPLPLFHGASLQPPATTIPLKLPPSTLPSLPGGGHMRDFATIPPHLFNEYADSFAKEGSALPPVKEKPKRVRKSRGGTSSNRRGTPETVLDTNFEGVEQMQLPPPPKRRRPSAKLSNDSETVEKPPPRKRNRSKAKANEEQLLSFSTNETSLCHADPMSSKGILGMYGLDSKTLDLSQYMKDISVESLMVGDLNTPSFSGKQGPPSNSIIDNSFGTQVSSLLQNLTKPVNTDRARPGSLFAKPTESKPLKFSLDLESSPIGGREDCLGVGLFESKIKVSHKESSTPFLQSRKEHEPPSPFNLETIPVTPPADFWNTLQINSNGSLSSLIAQASTTTESRLFPSEVGSNGDKFSTLPPSIFSLGSPQIPQESPLASSKLNQWYRSEPSKWESMETQPQHSVAFPRGSMFPFKLDTGSDPLVKPSERCGLKDGLFDIDLNKQSPEAEAAESIAHTTSSNLFKPQVSNKVPTIVQAKVDVNDTDKEPQSVQISVCVNAPTPVNEVDDTCNIKLLPARQDLDHASETHVTSQQKDETAERTSEKSVSAIVDKQPSNESVKDVVPINVSSSLPSLFVPEVLETQEMCSTDVPYSPGMHATAHILCKMANSSSPFYFEKNDKHVQVMECDVDACIRPPAKAAKVSGPVENEARTYKHTALHESWNEEYMVKSHSKDGIDKLVFSHMGGSNGPNTEPWASTPPRHAPKNVASRTSGSQSSESDRSPCDGSKERRSHKDLGNTCKVQKDQKSAPRKVSSLCTRKDQNGNPRPAPKTSFLHTLPTTKGLSVPSQKKTTSQSLAAYGDGLTKVSRPRSNISKNCLQSQRSTKITNGYSVQNGCSLKSPTSRHVLPYVGEVRHGSK